MICLCLSDSWHIIFLTGSFFMYGNKAIAITLYFFEIKLLLLLLFRIIFSGS